MRKIRGNTVGTTISPDRVARVVTCEQIGAVTQEELDAVNQGLLNTIEAVDLRLNDVEIISEQAEEHIATTGNPHGTTADDVGAVTKLQHKADMDDLKSWADYEIFVKTEDVRGELSSHTETTGNPHGTTAEDVGATETLIVTVNGSTPSHTSQDIYAAIQAGKVVYLHLWGSTYLGIAACTESEARFEDSIISNITGADGESYSTQRYRMYYVKGSKYSTNGYEMASKAYVDAQIAHYLNQ